MSFEHCIQRVKRAERAADASTRRVADRWQQLRQAWHEAWTPGRIVIAGIASGFVVGRGELPKASGAGFINLVSAVSSLFAVDQAGAAAEVAEDAAGDAQQAVDVAADAVDTDAADAVAVADAPIAEEDEPIRAYEALRRSGAW